MYYPAMVHKQSLEKIDHDQKLFEYGVNVGVILPILPWKILNRCPYLNSCGSALLSTVQYLNIEARFHRLPSINKAWILQIK